NSIDFLLRLGQFPTFDPVDGEPGEIEDYEAKPSFDLHVYYGDDNYRPFASLYITDEEWEAMKRLGEVLDCRIIECWKDEQGRWRPKLESDGSPRFRDDKKDANHISTVKKVLESIDDGVSEQDLLDHTRSIHRAWKMREDAQKPAAPPVPQLQKERTNPGALPVVK
ncbi:hypothetical protein LTS18_013961, partial [Coniosporium uncinatum]